MFSGDTFALLFYKCLQLCGYLCPGHKLDPVSGVCILCSCKEQERWRVVCMGPEAGFQGGCTKVLGKGAGAMAPAVGKKGNMFKF